MRQVRLSIAILSSFILATCSNGKAVSPGNANLNAPQNSPIAASVSPSNNQPLIATDPSILPSFSVSEGTLTQTPAGSLLEEMPVIPEISGQLLKIYQRGIELGNNPHAFSKIGDCGSTPSWFLGDFDRGTRYYDLGDYQYLQQVIDYYQGSFDRTSLAAKAGFNTSSVLTPLWSDKSQCNPDETPLACEYRNHKPLIAFITLGANDVYHLDIFEEQLRSILEFSIENGTIPILATKPDNVEKDNKVNFTIIRLANEYKVPLWNYWLAVQPLPNHGLQEDGVHITWASNNFSDKKNLESGWTVRNLTALQTLDAVYKQISSLESAP